MDSSEIYGEYNLTDNADHQIVVNKIPEVSH